MAAESTFSHLVVIGASAGGIEALSELVSTLPGDFSAPIVIAQHLDPDRGSYLEQILSRRSTLPVRTITDHAPLEAGVVFVVPSNHHVSITDSEIDLSEDTHGRPMPSVDLLFSSASAVYQERLIGVILTGTGTDGAEGARVISAAGGTVVVQDPETAEFGAMPAALAPNTVDIVADLDRIGPLLGQIVREDATPAPQAGEELALGGFLDELRERHGIDFKSYKTATILRRLRRRMVATGSESIEDYAAYLEDDPEEYRRLVSTFLIKVTEFFRDPELFDYLREEILPRLITEAREEDRQLRIWSAGCATGEEAYSLAMLVSEVLGGDAGLFNVRIFATDVDEDAVNFARQGIYPPSALPGLSEEQIERYFTEDNGRYQVKKQVRGMIVFGEHDLAQRFPFPRVDLVLSRNVLIYFTPELQRRALQLFAYSLRDSGYLVLGKAETTSPLGEFFVPEHRQYKVYRRRGERFLMPPTISAGPTPAARPRTRRGRRASAVRLSLDIPSNRVHTREENLVNQLPVGVVVVDRRYDIQTINAVARRLLSIRGAAVGEDLLHTMQDEVPYAEIRSAIDSSFRDGLSTTSEFSVEEAISGERRYLQLICYPQRESGGRAEAVTIVVNDVTEIGRARRELEESLQETRAEFERFSRETEADMARRNVQHERLIESNRRLEEANRELTKLNEELQNSYEETLLGAEETQAATEEVATLNEELQATNEELETLNEELQATIEELNTTNDDLQARTAELQDLAWTGEEERGRLRAILESIPEAVLVVDAGGRTVLTNATYGRLFRDEELPADDDLNQTAALVGRQVSQFVDRRRAETERERSLSREREARRALYSILESISDAFFAVDCEWRFTYVNRRAEELWSRCREGLLGKNLWEELPQAADSDQYREIRRAMEERTTTSFEAFSPVLGVWVAGQAYPSPNGGVSVYFDDVTERRREEEERERLAAHELTARAQTEERRRLSRELHDRVAHDMALVYQSLELYGALKESDPERAASKIELARQTVMEALDSTRNLSMELMEPEVRRGLEAALADLLRDLVPPDVRVDLSVSGDETLIPPETRNQLFLILREAIRNAVTHSGCSRITVEVEIIPNKAAGSVEDDGRGFDVEGVGTASVGLQSMKERTALLGGELRLTPEPGVGTKVMVSVPLDGER